MLISAAQQSDSAFTYIHVLLPILFLYGLITGYGIQSPMLSSRTFFFIYLIHSNVYLLTSSFRDRGSHKPLLPVSLFVPQTHSRVVF